MMKKLIVIIASCVLFAASSMAYARQFGPPEPAAKEGKVALGVGYFNYSAKWKEKVPEGEEPWEIKFKQNQAYIQASYGIIRDGEIYIRVGGADLKEEDVVEPFKDDFKPFGTIGIKGVFNVSPSFGIGPFLQASLYSSYKDEYEWYDEWLEVTETFKVKLKNPWEINLGIGLQGKIGEAIIYGGPVAYWTESKVDWTWTVGPITESGSLTFEEKNKVGGFVGVRLPLTKELSFEVEGQLKSRFSMGGALTYAF